jgi:acetylglutamate kinase
MMAVNRAVGQVDYGFAGDVVESGVNTSLIHTLLEADLVPVLAPLTHDGKGSMLNTNADTVAQETAKAFADIARVQLIYCLEKPGVLSDADNDASVIPQITEASFTELVKTGVITAGMIPKLENAFKALQSGVKKIIIGRAEDLPYLLTGGRGTHIL